MLQEIDGILQKLTEEAPDIYYFARLIDTEIGRVVVFCEHPATCPPDIPIGKRTKEKAPARSIIVSILFILSPKYDTKNLQFVEHGKVWSN